jgi:hypothetical protein
VPCFAIQRQLFFIAQDVRHAGVDTPLNFQVAPDQFFAKRDKFLFVDGRLLVSEDEEADIVIADQALDFIDDLLRIANAIVAPEFPLRAEAAGERTTPRHVGNGDALAHRDVCVFAPFQHAPIG